MNINKGSVSIRQCWIKVCVKEVDYKNSWVDRYCNSEKLYEFNHIISKCVFYTEIK